MDAQEKVSVVNASDTTGNVKSCPLVFFHQKLKRPMIDHYVLFYLYTRNKNIEKIFLNNDALKAKSSSSYEGY